MRVLVAEDDAVSRCLLEVSLVRWGYEAVVCADGREALAALTRSDGPCLAVLAWTMPEIDGLEVCRRLRERSELPYVYVILLTARGEKEDLVLGMEAGADDYLVKPFDPQELRARLRAGRRILDLQMQLVAARERLREQAVHDPLTQLLNHSAILDALRREQSRARRGRAPLGVLMLDIDHFRGINDANGHVTGDEVLREVADRLRDNLRDYDSIGRYGGEEFLVILPDCNAESARVAAERIRKAMESPPVRTSRGNVAMTVSIGLAISPAESPVDGALLPAAADVALRRAKGSGRNRTETATPDDILAGQLLRPAALPPA